MRLPWDTWEVEDSEVSQVAEKFVMANCYDRKIAMQFFNDVWAISFKFWLVRVVPGIEFLKTLCLRKKVAIHKSL